MTNRHSAASANPTACALLAALLAAAACGPTAPVPPAGSDPSTAGTSAPDAPRWPGPSEQELAAMLDTALLLGPDGRPSRTPLLPEYWEVTRLQIQRASNAGTEIQPQIQGIFSAELSLTDDMLRVVDEFQPPGTAARGAAAGDRTLIVAVERARGATTSMAGKYIATQPALQWQPGFQVDPGVITGLVVAGERRGSLKAAEIIISGSDRDREFRARHAAESESIAEARAAEQRRRQEEAQLAAEQARTEERRRAEETRRAALQARTEAFERLATALGTESYWVSGDVDHQRLSLQFRAFDPENLTMTGISRLRDRESAWCEREFSGTVEGPGPFVISIVESHEVIAGVAGIASGPSRLRLTLEGSLTGTWDRGGTHHRVGLVSVGEPVLSGRMTRYESLHQDREWIGSIQWPGYPTEDLTLVFKDYDPVFNVLTAELWRVRGDARETLHRRCTGSIADERVEFESVMDLPDSRGRANLHRYQGVIAASGENLTGTADGIAEFSLRLRQPGDTAAAVLAVRTALGDTQMWEGAGPSGEWLVLQGASYDEQSGVVTGTFRHASQEPAALREWSATVDILHPDRLTAREAGAQEVSTFELNLKDRSQPISCVWVRGGRAQTLTLHAVSPEQIAHRRRVATELGIGVVWAGSMQSPANADVYGLEIELVIEAADADTGRFTGRLKHTRDGSPRDVRYMHRAVSGRVTADGIELTEGSPQPDSRDHQYWARMTYHLTLGESGSSLSGNFRDGGNQLGSVSLTRQD